METLSEVDNNVAPPIGADDAAAATALFEANGETVWTLGVVEAGSGPAHVELSGWGI